MKITKQIRQQVYEKYNGKCGYSGTDLEPDWQIDHVIPQHIVCSADLYLEVNSIENLIPCQKLINHYKRGLLLHDFREWCLGGLHERLQKLPKNPRTEKTIKRIKYMRTIAGYFKITEQKPFDGKFYFEKITQ